MPAINRRPRKIGIDVVKPIAARQTVFTASEPTELLHFGLPNLAGVRMPVHDQVPAEAAE